MALCTGIPFLGGPVKPFVLIGGDGRDVGTLKMRTLVLNPKTVEESASELDQDPKKGCRV